MRNLSFLIKKSEHLSYSLINMSHFLWQTLKPVASDRKYEWKARRDIHWSADQNMWLTHSSPVGRPDLGPNYYRNLPFPANPTDGYWQASRLMPLLLPRRAEWMWLAQSVALRKGCSAVIQLLFVYRLQSNRKQVYTRAKLTPSASVQPIFLLLHDALCQNIRFKLCNQSKGKTCSWMCQLNTI